MQQTDGIRRLSEKEKFLALKYCLLHPNSPMWGTSLWQKLVPGMRKGQKDLIAFRNSRDLTELIVEGLQRKLDLPIYRSQTTPIRYNNYGNTFNGLWKTVISRQIQFRLQIRFIEWREFLLRLA